MELDILGDQLMFALAFRKSGFRLDLKIRDEVQKEDLVSGGFFFEEGGRWFVRGESLPGHLAIKCIAVDTDGLYLETSPLRFDAVQALIAEKAWPVRYDPEAKAFVDAATGRTLISVSDPAEPDEEGTKLGKRVLWTVPLAALAENLHTVAVPIADAIYTEDLYDVEPEEVETGPVTSRAAARRVSIRLQLGLMQRLTIEQRPILSRLKLKLIPEARTELSLELQQALRLHHATSRMNSGQLEGFFARYVATHGAKSAEKVAVFLLAGKVKQAKPGTNWKEARRQARVLIHRRRAS